MLRCSDSSDVPIQRSEVRVWIKHQLRPRGRTTDGSLFRRDDLGLLRRQGDAEPPHTRPGHFEQRQ